jgi:dipeptidyl aminopeptidase/acylaminoacyl peptidase
MVERGRSGLEVPGPWVLFFCAKNCTGKSFGNDSGILKGKTWAERRSEECALATKTQLADIKFAIENLQKQIPESVGKPIFILGHSYGAYLVNLLATDPKPITNVRAYISYQGVWDTRHLEPSLQDQFFSNKFNPIDQAANQLQSILILHSSDDPILPMDQIEAFKNWSQNGSDKYQAIVYPEGGHAISKERFNKSFKDLMQSIFDYLG